MKNILQIILISFVTFSIISCAKPADSPKSTTIAGVTSGGDGTNGKNSLISTTTESSGANCATGGLKVQSGLDSDEDGVLDSNEVAATTYVCNGSNGIKPAASLYCGAALSGTSVNFTYDAMLFSDGSVFVYGGIYTSDQLIGKSTFYDSSQSGATTAAVLLTYDLSGTDNWGYWSISVNRSTLVVTILYTDSNESGGSTTWTLSSSSATNCVLNSY